MITGSKRALALATILMAAMSPAQAQVQRTLINLGFEQPSLGAATCYRTISETVVPGWTTTHPSIATQTTTCDNTNIPGAPTSGAAMEFWANSFNATPAREGTQLVELNASAASRLSQSVCLINGEQVNWVFSHRGRSSATTHDVMDYLVGSSQIVRVRTTSNGTGNVVTTSLGTATSAAASNGWRDYSGTFTYTGTTGSSNMGFSAISTAGGDTTVGNFLDRIQISLRPFVEFVQASHTKAENTGASTANLPRVRVTGTVPAGGMTITATITGGTATLGTDYTTPGNSTTLSISVPAGVYDGTTTASEFPVPVTLTSDAVAEANETITFSLPTPAGSPPPYLLASTVTCGGTVLTTSTLTITDNVARVALAKTVVSRPPTGSSAFTVAIGQNSGTVASASTTTSSTSASTGVQLVTPGVAVTLSDTMAAGSTLLLNQFVPSISCSNSAASSTVLPSGVSDAGTWTFTPATNDNITCTISNTVRAPTINLTKIVAGRGDPTDQFTVTVREGASTVLGSATTSGTGTTASTGAVALNSLSSTYSINETMAAGSVSVMNQYTVAVACSNSRPGGVASPPLAPNGTGGFNVTASAGDVIACSLTNTPLGASLVLRKALGTSRLNNNDEFTMTVTGPGGGSSTSTGSGSTVGSGQVTVASATVGTQYTLSEAAAAGSVNPLSSYTGTMACTNTRSGATTPLPSGGGYSFTVTPRAGDNITCTITNAAGNPVLAITKTDGQGTYAPGGSATYTITVSNSGNATAAGIPVVDNLPAGVTLSGPWSCSASAGSSCSAASGGSAGGTSVSTTVTVAVGGTVTLTVPVSFSASPGAY